MNAAAKGRKAAKSYARAAQLDPNYQPAVGAWRARAAPDAINLDVCFWKVAASLHALVLLFPENAKYSTNRLTF